MSQSTGDFDLLMQRVREGNEDAARELLGRYGDHILRVVRRRLLRKLRSKFDSSDFVQAVWASFFTRGRQNYTFDHPDALIAFLVTLAQNKVVDAVRQRVQTQKYNVNREHSLDGSTAAEAIRVAAPDPTPSQEVSAREEWSRLLQELPTQYQRMLVLLREGHTQREIAEVLGVNERTIRRVIEKLKAEPAA